ncbi:hypothetical protein OXX80_003685 [Metschnikowia pulcherrima]
MFALKLLQKIICTLFILSMLGQCAVIPQTGLESFAETDPKLVHKWDKISRIRTKVGPTDSSSRDRLLNEKGKAPKNSANLPSSVDGAAEKSTALLKAKVERDSLRSGREIDLTRSTKPPSVKSTAGHVGYEERHRFSGIPFDQLLDTNSNYADLNTDGIGGSFESDHETDMPSGNDSDGDFSMDSDEEEDSAETSSDASLLYDNNNPLEPESEEDDEGVEQEHAEEDVENSEEKEHESQEKKMRQASIQAIASETATSPRGIINWRASSRSKAANVSDKKNRRQKLNWKASSQSKVEGSAADESIHWQTSSHSKAGDLFETQGLPEQIHWKVSSKSKATDAYVAQNPHDQQHTRVTSKFDKAGAAPDIAVRATRAEVTPTTPHREKDTT